MPSMRSRSTWATTREEPTSSTCTVRSRGRRASARPVRAGAGRRGRPASTPAAPAVPPVRTIVLDRAPAARRARRDEREAVRPAAAGSGPERLQLEDVSIAYGGQTGRQVGVAVDPPGRGAGPDRALRVRQDDAAAHAQPPHRADPQRRPRRQHPARRRGHPRPARHQPALARGDGLPAAQPVPDVDLRQRRLRAARTVTQAAAAARSSSRS